jgi:hypothetical protein
MEINFWRKINFGGKIKSGMFVVGMVVDLIVIVLFVK